MVPGACSTALPPENEPTLTLMADASAPRGSMHTAPATSRIVTNRVIGVLPAGERADVGIRPTCGARCACATSSDRKAGSVARRRGLTANGTERRRDGLPDRGLLSRGECCHVGV